MSNIRDMLTNEEIVRAIRVLQELAPPDDLTIDQVYIPDELIPEYEGLANVKGLKKDKT